MKLLELGLLRFGPFTGVRLDLSASGVHVVYGPNEAGKSTSLRAIEGLLYGIPQRTGDAHLHRMEELRVSGRIQAPDGRVLDVVRRKGRKRTLLDAQGDPIDESVMSAALSGVGVEAFRAMYGLDQVALRSGAEALLAGQGHIGESLFDAGTGGRSVQRLLAELRQDAEALYTPRAQTRKLNAAKKACDEARRRVGLMSVSAEGYVQQKRHLEQKRVELDAAHDRWKQLEAEQRRLERAVRVLPKLAQRREALRERGELGTVVRLPAGAAEARLAAVAQLDASRRETGKVERELERLAVQRDALSISESLVNLPSDVIEGLRDRLGNHRKAAVDLPKRQGRLRALEEEITRMLRGLRTDLPIARIDELRVGTAPQARIKKLATRLSGLVADVDNGRRDLARLDTKLARRTEEVACLEVEADVRLLRGLLGRLTALGDVDERVASMGRMLSVKRQKLERARDALGLDGDPARLARLAVPSVESVDAHASQIAELERRRAVHEDELRRLTERKSEVSQERRRLRLEGEVPTEDQLTEARKERDSLWGRLRSDSKAPRRKEYEEAVVRADTIADRLRREANRVAEDAQLAAELTSLEQALESSEIRGNELAERFAELHSRWRLSWVPVGVEARAAEEMREWILGWRDLVALVDEVDAQSAEFDTTEQVRETARAELLAALAGHGPSPTTALSTGALITRAQKVVDEVTEAAAARRDLERSIAELRDEIAERRRALEDRQAALDAWRADWARAVNVLGLPGGASPEEATAVLDELGQLFSKVGEMQDLSRRIVGIDRDAARFEEEVRSLAAGHLGGDVAPVEELAVKLVDEHARTMREAAERKLLDREIEGRQAELREHYEARVQAEAILDGLMQQACVVDLRELEDAEARSERAIALEHRIGELDGELLAMGDGASVDDLLEQTRDVDPDATRARLSVLDDEIDAARDAWGELKSEAARTEMGLARVEEGAAEAASDLQAAVATARAHARRYVRLRLATLVLEREIERYREQNQDPILERAGALLERLTSGRYRGLREGLDAKDEPVLRCVRSDGSFVGTEGLSEGTRDQLYLALRLASIERHGEANPPMPLVLDDVLTTFDEARTEAALGVLGEVAESHQVVYFTHHARVVELAERALGSRLVVIDLENAGARGASASALLS